METLPAKMMEPLLGPRAALPVGWAAKSKAIRCRIEVGQLCALEIAVLVAEGRADFATPGEWVAACVEEFGWQPAHVHHLRKVGDLLLETRGKVFHETLTACETQKLLAIARIPRAKLKGFLADNDVVGLEREEVRGAVNDALGQRKPARLEKARQLDFMDALFAVTSTQMDAATRAKLAASDRVKPLSAMISGLSLVSVATEKYSLAQSVDETELEEAIDELDSIRARLLERLAHAGAPALTA